MSLSTGELESENGGRLPTFAELTGFLAQDGGSNTWMRAALALSAFAVGALTLGWTGGRDFILLAGVGGVVAPTAATAACMAARATASAESRGSWTLAAVGCLLAAAAHYLTSGLWTVPNHPVLRTVGVSLVLAFHLVVAEAAILALRPARDTRLAVEIALDGILFLLAASAFVLLTVIDGPLEQGVLSASQATATVLGQFSIAASLIFVALLVYWRDTELSRSAVQGLLVAVVLLGIGHFQLIVGLEFPTPGTPQVSDIAALLGWLVLVSSGLIATLRPGPTPRSQARTAKARRFRQLVIPAAALFLTWWAVTTTGRPVSRLSTVVIVTMGLLLAIRIGVAILAMERESEERHRAEQLASRLRLRSVMGQMSPHFLFNALHSLSALVRRDPRSAEDVVERLGLLLRYGIDTGDDMVRLKDEWGFATGYLELEKVRLRSRLNTTAHLASEAADTLVPPFIIQPLVENAIHHAVNPFAIGGEIEMVAELQGDRLRIEVRDTGPGADDETLSTASGVGLRGVRAQLSTHYAEGEWSLHGGRTGDGRFFMRMELPAG